MDSNLRVVEDLLNIPVIRGHDYMPISIIRAHKAGHADQPWKAAKRWLRNMHSDGRMIKNFSDVPIFGGNDCVSELVIRRVEPSDRLHPRKIGEGWLRNVRPDIGVIEYLCYIPFPRCDQNDSPPLIFSIKRTDADNIRQDCQRRLRDMYSH